MIAKVKLVLCLTLMVLALASCYASPDNFYNGRNRGGDGGDAVYGNGGHGGHGQIIGEAGLDGAGFSPPSHTYNDHNAGGRGGSAYFGRPGNDGAAQVIDGQARWPTRVPQTAGPQPAPGGTGSPPTFSSYNGFNRGADGASAVFGRGGDGSPGSLVRQGGRG